MQNFREPQITETILKKNNRVEGVTLLNFKTPADLQFQNSIALA